MNARRTVPPVALAVSLLALADAPPGAAQEPNPNVPVTDRPRPELDPLGIRTGGFLIFPSVTVSGTYDDNIFADPEDEESDFVTVLQPRVRAVSNFPRHALGVSVGSDIAFFASNSDENFQDVFASADGQLDITQANNLRGELEAGRFAESREDPEEPGIDERTHFLRYGGELSYLHRFTRFNTRLTGRVNRVQFEEESEEDRDRVDYDALLRLGYAISPRINTFVEGRYNLTDRDEDVDRGGFDRDSQGWEARAGTAVDFTAVLFGEAYVGYRQQYFDDDAFDSAGGISFGADLTWNVTGLTTIALSGAGDFVPTTQTGASSNFRHSIALSVDHELLRNLLLGASVGYIRDDFEGIDRIDDRINAGASVTYFMNRNLALEGAYRFSDRSSDLDTEEFTRNQITLSVTARL